jgi:integrase
MEAAEWNIPGRRMKAGEPHRAPLSQPALDVLRSMELLRTETDPVFPGQVLKRPMTDTALTRPLHRAGRGDLTARGFRLTFRDWAAEATAYPNHWWSRRWRTRSATRLRRPTGAAICSLNAWP